MVDNTEAARNFMAVYFLGFEQRTDTRKCPDDTGIVEMRNHSPRLADDGIYFGILHTDSIRIFHAQRCCSGQTYSFIGHDYITVGRMS